MRQSDHAYGDKIKGMKLDFSSIGMDCKSFYPGDLVYELMMPANLLKKIEGMK
jgi:hypothetical protein